MKYPEKFRKQIIIINNTISSSAHKSTIIKRAYEYYKDGLTPAKARIKALKEYKVWFKSY